MIEVSNTGKIGVNVAPINTSRVGNVNVTVNQVASASTRSKRGSNIPVGLYFAFQQNMLAIASGFVTVDETKYILTENWIKNASNMFTVGNRGGLLLNPLEQGFTGDYTIYAISNGVNTDIAASLDAEPGLPTGFVYRTKLGTISFENGNIVSVYPTHDLAYVYIEGEYQQAIDTLTASVSTLESEVQELQETQEYTHEQGISSDTWHIEHNLNRRPSVTVVDSSGATVTGLVTYIDDNTVEISFNSAFKGTAYLN